MGFTQPIVSPQPLVVSYTTVSPLPALRPAVYFLLHLPAGRPGWVLPTIVPCGVRTFLSLRRDRPTDSSAPRLPSSQAERPGVGVQLRDMRCERCEVAAQQFGSPVQPQVLASVVRDVNQRAPTVVTEV